MRMSCEFLGQLAKDVVMFNGFNSALRQADCANVPGVDGWVPDKLVVIGEATRRLYSSPCYCHEEPIECCRGIWYGFAYTKTVEEFDEICKHLSEV